MCVRQLLSQIYVQGHDECKEVFTKASTENRTKYNHDSSANSIIILNHEYSM